MTDSSLQPKRADGPPHAREECRRGRGPIGLLRGPLFLSVVILPFACPGTGSARQIVDIGPQGGTSWGPRLDSLAVAGGTRGVWRGVDLGSPSARAVADLGIWGRPVTAAGDWGVSFMGTALWVPDPGGETRSGSRLEGALSAGRRLDDDRATLSLVVSGYYLPQDAGESSGIEGGLRLSGVQVPWPLGETWPVLDAAVLVDQGRFDGTHAEVGVMLPLIASIFRLHSWVAGRVHANDYGDGSFEYRAFETSLGFGLDLGGGSEFIAPMAGPWKLTMSGSLVKPRKSPLVGWGDVGLAYIH